MCPSITGLLVELLRSNAVVNGVNDRSSFTATKGLDLALVINQVANTLNHGIEELDAEFAKEYDIGRLVSVRTFVANGAGGDSCSVT